jgi:dolichol-phosphate mannosyltransferase
VNDTLVIVPTYNERESLIGVVDRILAASSGIDVLVVDDNSPDGTGTIAEDFARSHPNVQVLHRDEKNGLGPAYIAGFRWAFERQYDWIVELDADGSHDADVIPTLVGVAKAITADLVLGSRWVPGGRVDGWSFLRQIISRAGNSYARLALKSNLHDMTSGFRVLHVSTLRTIHLETIASSGYCFQIEIADRIEQSGGTIIEHPITFVEREAGKSKMHLGIVFEAFARITGWGFSRWVLDR